VIDLNLPTTQAIFGEIVGISQPAVSGLIQRGMLLADAALCDWLLSYCEHLREIAAGRASTDDGINLVTERALLAREQRDKIAMQNAVTRKELSPTPLLEEVLSRAAARACPLLDTIPGELRRRVAGLDADALDVVAGIVAKARNTIRSISLDDLLEDEGTQDIDAGDVAVAQAVDPDADEAA